MTIIRVRIEGVAPLMQRRFSAGPIGPAETRPNQGAEDPLAQADASLYRGDDGVIYQPAVHIERALEEAGAQMGLPTRGALFVQPDRIRHEGQKYIVDARPVTEGGARVMRYRARFDGWGLHFEIVLLNGRLTEAAVRGLLDHAGRYVGIGEYRPRLGRFVVTAWEIAGTGQPPGASQPAGSGPAALVPEKMSAWPP